VNFSRIVLIATGLVALGLVLARVLDRESDNTDSKDKLVTASINTDTPSSEPKESEANSAPIAQERLNTTVKTKDLSIGGGKRVQAGNRISFHVLIQLMTGRVVFNSRDEGRPWNGTVGDGSILNGIDRGIRGMYQGGKRSMWIPATVAYGQHGIAGQVPPDSDLYAVVEVLSVF
jgi:peptidylprolyl isomerase